MTNGSMTADASLGSMERAPKLISNKADGTWTLWEKIAKNDPLFGQPSLFADRVDESKWESFTVTCKDPKFFQLMEAFSGNKAGTGALVTFKNSNWLMSVVLGTQPHFINQPEGTTVFWGYGLFGDKAGNFVHKKMPDCTGREIMAELCAQMAFSAADTESILNSCNCIPCMMPYITSQFRQPGFYRAVCRSAR